MRFDGAVAGPREVSLEGAATPVHYLIGADRDRWQVGLEARARVRFRDVYPGIDVAYYGTDREVEYDILLDAGADPEQVRLRLSGTGRVAINADGDLELGTTAAPVRVRAPFAYQLEGQARSPVASRYRLHADGTVGFALGRFDRRKALVIDPDPELLDAAGRLRPRRSRLGGGRRRWATSTSPARPPRPASRARPDRRTASTSS